MEAILAHVDDTHIMIWLVVWNMAFIFPNSWNDDPIWRTHIFQRWLNHQPDNDFQNPEWKWSNRYNDIDVKQYYNDLDICVTSIVLFLKNIIIVLWYIYISTIYEWFPVLKNGDVPVRSFENRLTRSLLWHRCVPLLGLRGRCCCFWGAGNGGELEPRVFHPLVSWRSLILWWFNGNLVGGLEHEFYFSIY